MVSFNIIDVKDCMSHLLIKDTFDSFLFMEGDITTFNRFHIDGLLQFDFFDTEQAETLDKRKYSLWKEVKDFCFSIVRGKKTPLHMKLIFSLSPENTQKFLTQADLPFTPDMVKGLYLNFHYDGSALKCITGTSMHTFTMDKSLEHAWDDMAKQLFIRKKIAVEM